MEEYRYRVEAIPESGIPQLLMSSPTMGPCVKYVQEARDNGDQRTLRIMYRPDPGGREILVYRVEGSK